MPWIRPGGGRDEPSNMQWQTKEEAKDRTERRGLHSQCRTDQGASLGGSRRDARECVREARALGRRCEPNRRGRESAR